MPLISSKITYLSTSEIFYHYYYLETFNHATRRSPQTRNQTYKNGNIWYILHCKLRSKDWNEFHTKILPNYELISNLTFTKHLHSLLISNLAESQKFTGFCQSTMLCFILIFCIKSYFILILTSIQTLDVRKFENVLLKCFPT